MTNEFILQDRLQKIQQIVTEYGEENFYISFSGGKDSTVLSALVDMAIPDNDIPRVYADTGIELKMIRDFVLEMQKEDERIILIKPSIPITKMLEKDGYPFKSKLHSKALDRFQRIGKCNSVKQYLGERKDKKPWSPIMSCPSKLRYQFENGFNTRVSDKCCSRMKEEPLMKWQRENNKPFSIVGIMREEGGRRKSANCLSFRGKKLKAFQPMVSLTKEWEEWFIEEYFIKTCDIYKEPYNFERTGCKGCPFAVNLQHELDILEKYFPAERKQCESIWRPVYSEYRRLNYRLKREVQNGH